MPLFATRPRLPDPIRAELGLESGEKVLGFAVERAADGYVVATNRHLMVATPAGRGLRRPWHEVDAGQWDPDEWTLSVTWVDGARPGRWTFGPQVTRLPEVFHERVQASVVISEPLPLTGRSRGRVVVRRDLSGGPLMVQTVLAATADEQDPKVREALARTIASVRDQVGL